ncbi:MAG: carboxypeptidase regulatory-like domain-containing protein, partial [bacterium]|nr:carboxypeptidase regulatory-like domain-containing protein [bacterium]
GSMLELKALGEKFSGKYFVTSVKHKFVPLVGFETFFFVEKNTGLMKTSGGAVVGSSAAAGAAPEKKEERGYVSKDPVIKNLKWLDKDGEEITEAMEGERVTMHAEVENLKDNSPIAVTLYEKDYNTPDDLVERFETSVEKGEVNVSWTFKYMDDSDDVGSDQEKKEKGYTKPEYFFWVQSKKFELKEESEILEFKDFIELTVVDESTGEPMANADYTITLPDGNELKGKLDDKGFVRIDDVPPGYYTAVVSDGEDEFDIFFD